MTAVKVRWLGRMFEWWHNVFGSGRSWRPSTDWGCSLKIGPIGEFPLARAISRLRFSDDWR